MKVVVLQSNYFPWRGYFDLVRSADKFIFYDEVKYTKNDWRNRNQVYSVEKSHWISIPVSSDSVKMKISEVSLDFDPKWKDSHIALLDFCYRKSPLYKTQLKPLIYHFFYEKSFHFLSDLNQYIIKTISKEAGFLTVFENSKDYSLIDGRVERLVDLVVKGSGTEYISGPSAKEYLNGSEGLFEKSGIKLSFFQYPDYKKYAEQQRPRFLSILDFLAFEKVEFLNNFLNINEER